MSRETISHRIFIERLVIALIVIGIALLLWNLRGLFILAFGAVLVSVILRLIARPLCERTGLPAPFSLLCAVLLVVLLIGTAAWTFGAEVMRQAEGLRAMIPAAWAAVMARLDGFGLGEPVRQWTASLGAGDGVIGHIGAIARSIGSGIADALLVIVGGIYLAAQPDLYRTGLLKLVPARGRELAAEALDASGRALHLWLLGRLVSMLAVGFLTWLGLTLIGVPSALTLALLAGLLEFVPFIGPIVAALPAVLLAFAAGPDKALWTGAPVRRHPAARRQCDRAAGAAARGRPAAGPLAVRGGGRRAGVRRRRHPLRRAAHGRALRAGQAALRARGAAHQNLAAGREMIIPLPLNRSWPSP